jgi:hypothetical protein
MEKFDSRKHNKLIKKLPFSYLSLPLYLDFCAYVLERNGEQILVSQDPLYSHDFPALFLPKNKKNWQRALMSMITREEMEKINKENIEVSSHNPTEIEYFYETKDFINPEGNLKKRIKQFEKLYPYKLKEIYSKKKIVSFFDVWTNQKEKENDVYNKESTEFFYFCLNNLKKYDIRQVYVEIDGNLAGFIWGIKHSKNKWVSLHAKINYKYRGLSRFIQHKLALRFEDCKLFSMGTGCNDAGLIQFKKEMHPVFERQYYYISTKNKRS